MGEGRGARKGGQGRGMRDERIDRRDEVCFGRENKQGKGVRDEGICRRDEKSGRGG